MRGGVQAVDERRGRAAAVLLRCSLPSGGKGGGAESRISLGGWRGLDEEVGWLVKEDGTEIGGGRKVPLIRSSEMNRFLSFWARSLRSSSPSAVIEMRKGSAEEEM